MSEHVKAQALRFVRITGLALLAILAANGGKLTPATLWAAAPGFLETVLRQYLPVKAIPAVTSVPAATVVPTTTAPTPPLDGLS